MKNKKLFIYGVGGLADYAAYVFKNDSDFEVLGSCIEKTYLEKNPNDSKETKIYEDIEDKLLQENTFLFIAVGNNIVRERIYNMSKHKGIKMATYISSKASTWENLVIGENCFIGEGSVIQPFVKIGNNCILFGARLGHHTVMGDHVLLSGPTIGGNVRVGDFSFIGLNSVVLQNLEIGSKNIIGMGVAIKTSTGEGEVYSSPNFTKRKVSFDDISKNYLN
ncbi:acetyltransferase [Gillisia limnaea]|uniref:Transferase hexapeptide repeat containing protein n=1 Tax=Gillisia limnaea (strain DSM 15749 / LMG 21470 / R-8282) TaxID=865937 RepID=H2BRR7_GILLR|nr:acetyltransferase [Gillisia limnaea]EHQ01382.1 transferase hexapeptide repeat containing protein [Gillisia limnaea DSM 15749]